MIVGRNGHIYLWSSDRSKYIEAQEIEPEELPYDVKQRIREKREDARCVLVAAANV
jgi:hypothetical protein